jgi:uncharacterized protein YjbI with pentapeptide repeats
MAIKKVKNRYTNETIAEGPTIKEIVEENHADLGGADLGRADLAGADLGWADLGGAYLVGANLVGADLGGANLVGADLAGANLVGADLGGADLGGANLGGADLAGADLAGADLAGADLAGADLENIKIPPINDRYFISEILFRHAKIDSQKNFAGRIRIDTSICWSKDLYHLAKEMKVINWATKILSKWDVYAEKIKEIRNEAME